MPYWRAEQPPGVAARGVTEKATRAFQSSIEKHFDVDEEARALLLDWLVMMPLDELVRRAVLHGVADPDLDVQEVGVKLAPSDHPHQFITVLRPVRVLRRPEAWWPGKRENDGP